MADTSSDRELLYVLTNALNEVGSSLGLKLQADFDTFLQTDDIEVIDIIKDKIIEKITMMTISKEKSFLQDKSMSGTVNLNHMNLPLNQWIENKEELPVPSVSFALHDDGNKSNTEDLLDLDDDTKERDSVDEVEVTMRSPVIQNLLTTWSSDPNKVLYVVNWVESLGSAVLPEAFPEGLQVVGLTPVLKEGFLLLLVPVIKKLSLYPVVVYIRRRLKDDNQTLAVVENNFNFVYDLRVKVIGGNAKGPTTRPTTRQSGQQTTAPPTPESGVAQWWSGHVDTLLQTPIAQGVLGSLWGGGPGAQGGSTTHTRGALTLDDERADAVRTPEEEEKFREEQRRWSRGITEEDETLSDAEEEACGRGTSVDGGSGLVGEKDTAPHRAVRLGEAALQQYGLNEELCHVGSAATKASSTTEFSTTEFAQSSSPGPDASGSGNGNGNGGKSKKLSIVEAKLAKLREQKQQQKQQGD